MLTDLIISMRYDYSYKLFPAEALYRSPYTLSFDVFYQKLVLLGDCTMNMRRLYLVD